MPVFALDSVRRAHKYFELGGRFVGWAVPTFRAFHRTRNTHLLRMQQGVSVCKVTRGYAGGARGVRTVRTKRRSHR